jgi:hypothetical protein
MAKSFLDERRRIWSLGAAHEHFIYHMIDVPARKWNVLAVFARCFAIESDAIATCVYNMQDD